MHDEATVPKKGGKQEIESMRPTVEWHNSRGENHDERGRGITNVLGTYIGPPTFAGLHEEEFGGKVQERR